ncbi:MULTISPECIES: SLAP domain-containing protein [unclassified Sporosarcina]|uniref:SLAP domain-containing protein n=1 Tax=unclassified Sporosarcina TaxID=2647733 RepID=UPI000C1712F8|nr:MULTISPECIES: SLAP domain-containing protein [unclassified Sporosarcina]PIC98413.1 hypothetical protein CSV68_13280 [Sporosarcina sp. P29]PID04766.1 hypothetical protein CSV66_13425 [Sporosarcina sp. P30]PID07920.1 hypothetical protein CSV65_13625 [Sporosarcina sp. P31]PID11106.1 hypothetical protein CSV64_13655 [Sporosarcina sp. P32b]
MQIVFEATWEATLSDKQKQAFILQYETKKSVHEEFTATPILLKRKRNGGLVATVFLQNNRNELLSIREAIVCVVNEHSDVVAEETFSLSLDIPPFAATPWSFIFLPTYVHSIEEPSDGWKVIIK